MLSSRLVNDLADTKYKSILVAVCIRDVKNKASIKLLENFKSKFIDLVVAADGLKFNIYKKKL